MPEATEADEPVTTSSRERLIDAAESMLCQADSPRITLDRVAVEAGLSRTTAYRIFGSNAELAGAVAAHRLDGHRQAVLEIGGRETDAISRIEDMAVHSLVAIVRDPVLRRLFDDDDLMKSPSLKALADEQLRPVVEQGRAVGQVRRDLETDEIIAWLLEVVTALASRHHDESTLRRRYSLFVRPGLMPAPPMIPAGELVADVDRRLRGAIDVLDKLRVITESGERGC